MSSSPKNDTSVDHDGCRLTGDFDLLRHSPVFSGLSLDIIKFFAYLANRHTYQQGDYLIKQGERANQAFILIAGSVEISVQHRNREVVLQHLEKDAFFGELALLARFSWFFNARAERPVEVLILTRGAFQKVLEHFPNHKDRLIERMIQLRVDRLVNQTSFMIETFLDADTIPTTALL